MIPSDGTCFAEVRAMTRARIITNTCEMETCEPIPWFHRELLRKDALERELREELREVVE